MSDTTVLFADICGSTHLYETQGDENAESIISDSLNALSKIVTLFNGQVVDKIGDEIMCQFSSAQNAVQAASEMHTCTTNNKFGNSAQSVSIRIGAHSGPIITVETGIQGDTVNVAARVAAQARSGKTMISESTVNLLPAHLSTQCRHIIQAQLKGKEELVDLYEVVWEDNDQLTRVAAPIQRTNNKQKELILTYHGEEISLSNGTLTIGRGLDCGLTIDSNQASRHHCEIRMNGNKFTLFDNSTNGTFILQNNVEMFFHNESAPLHMEGTISLGCSTKMPLESEWITYKN